MTAVTFEILFILLLIIANGVFSMSETALVSARKARLQQLANEGDAKARTALEVANAPNRFLSTVQIGITLIGIMTGAFGGATIASKLVGILNLVPLLAPYSESLSLGIVIACITYLSLVIGELVPKRLALNSPERIALAVASPMSLLSRLTAPVVYLLSVSTDAVVRLLGIRTSTEPPITEEEIRVLIEQGTQAGMFKATEQEMLERVFNLEELRVNALMTPRRRLAWLDVDDSPEENRRKINNSVYSRFPVCSGSLDNVLGVVQIKDLFVCTSEGQPINLTASLRQPIVVPESINALKVLELFKQSGLHIALVVDEYDIVQGLVTLNDILEAIVGEVPSVDEQTEPQVVQRADGSWLLDGMLPIYELKERLDVEKLPGEEGGGYHTLGGFVISQVGHIPTSGNYFEWRQLRFEVVDMDGNRVDKVLVMPISKDSFGSRNALSG
ncbi:hemolysin family protein [Allocoleopsis franciscana]|uniref:hemolysin family protein n=1 Tax=Allocoleopsis franciscana TaxID=2886352 RepID=UPI00059FA237|nr:hemolysin family protein [Allocoleopsis franciscana]